MALKEGERGGRPLSEDVAALCAIPEPLRRFDVVIVGSGYGGAVAAARLACATLTMTRIGGRRWRRPVSVCVLERGREYALGEFPDAVEDLPPAVQLTTPAGHLGSNDGLFDLRLSDDVSVLLGCALGGGSQINANVAVRPAPEVFARVDWPAALRQPGALADYYARAERVLEPRPYADGSYPPLTKLAALERFAAAQGWPCERPPITVRMSEEPNASGVEQHECRRCGNCVTGCNYGAKNTLTVNYLPIARRAGPQVRIFTGATAACVEPVAGGGFAVRFVPTPLRRYRRAGEPATPDLKEQAGEAVFGGVVILAAGTLGSSEILLRSSGVAGSGKLGARFSANGDFIGAGAGHHPVIGALGQAPQAVCGDNRPGAPPRGPLPAAPGPCITGSIQVRGADPRFQRGALIQEAAIPHALLDLFREIVATGKVLNDFRVGFWDGIELRLLQRGWPQAAKWLAALRGALRPQVPDLRFGDALSPGWPLYEHTQLYLAMGEDRAAGCLRLDRRQDLLRIHWPRAGEEPILAALDAALARSARTLGGTWVPSPAWRLLPPSLQERLAGTDRAAFSGQVFSVHPLGGCAMADRAEDGVVNADGQVFSGPAGDAVHPDLYVCDGSIIPTALGANPLLTIAALAERVAQRIAERRGWEIDFKPRQPPWEPLWQRTPSASPRHAALAFSESLTFPAMEQLNGAQPAWRLDLEIVIDDVEAFLGNPDHRARLVPRPEHQIRVPEAFAGPGVTALRVVRGSFRLFCDDDPARAARRAMRYDIRIEGLDAAGQPLRIRVEGVKRLRDDPGNDLWDDLNTMQTTWRREPGGPIAQVRLANHLARFQVPEVTDAAESIVGAAGFLRFYLFCMRVIARLYWKDFALGTVRYPGTPCPPPAEPGSLAVRGLGTWHPEIHWTDATDRIRVRLAHYVPERGNGEAAAGVRPPVVLFPGLGVSSFIFALDTVETNLVQHLIEKGFDVWLADYRTSILLPESCRLPATLDEVAAQDHPALIRKVMELTGQAKVRVVAHCMGAETFCMAVLGGWVASDWIDKAVLLQVGPVAYGRAMNAFKATLTDYVNLLFGEGAIEINTDSRTPWPGQMLDRLLTAYPLEAIERCDDPTCRRATGIYGLLWHHANLNDATHPRGGHPRRPHIMNELLGVSNARTYRHLAAIYAHGRLVSFEGRDAYYPNLRRMSFSLAIVHGELNQVFDPGCSQESIARLKLANPGGQYAYLPIPGYGHLDCLIGKDARHDVYDRISAHL